MRARIRSIKPEALTDEDLWDFEAESGYPVFRTFTGLWMHSDREGRFEWRPRMLKTGILPYWDGDFERVLDAFVTRGFVVKYASGGRDFGWVRTFKRHQVVNNKEEPSRLPEPPADSLTSTREPRVSHASSTCAPLKGTEGNGREGSRGAESRDGHAFESDEDPDAPIGEPRTHEAKLWHAWETVSGAPQGDRHAALRRLKQVWPACEARDRADPVAVFTRAARTFRDDANVKRKKLGLAVLCSQFGDWADVKREKTPEERKAYDDDIRRRAGL